MDWLGTWGVAMGAAWLFGVKLYASVLTLGLLQRLEFAHLPGDLRILGEWWVREGGLPFEPLLVAHRDGKPEGAEAALADLLALPQPPTAVFCYNDLSALGAMRQIRDCGLRIPADISVVGFDDLYISQYLNPPLTTVRQPMRQMGRMAMETLLQIFAGAESGHDIKVPGELIVRQSTAPPKESS